VLEDQSVSHTIGPEMRKDAPLAFRISAELKRAVLRTFKEPFIRHMIRNKLSTRNPAAASRTCVEPAQEIQANCSA